MHTPFSLEQVEAALARHGLGGHSLEMRRDTGYVNWVYLVGGEYVLRACKPHVGCEDALTEAVAVPVAVAAGIRTPELLITDTSHQDLPTTWSLYRRAEGQCLAEVHADQSRLPDLYRELGREMARIHQIDSCPDPNGWLDKGEYFDAHDELNRARAALKVEMVSYDWLAAWLDRLRHAFEGDLPTAFIHNDLHAGNTLVRPETLELTAIIDWGDAAWADPILDFETLPLFCVPWALEGYREAGGVVDDAFIGRLLYHDIGAALEATTEEWPPTPDPWSPVTTSRWLNLTRLMSMDLSEEWHLWLCPPVAGSWQ